MSKKLLFNYTFDASEKTIVIRDEFISQKELLLITNVTDGKIIYNFSNVNLGASLVSYDDNTGDTTIVLVYDTTGMSDSDELQIYYDKASVEFEPVEALIDPVSKIRVSNPNTLVDTDFEYGPQTTKWETIELVENNLLSDIEPETLEVQKLHRWQSDLHFLKSRFSVIETSHNTLKQRLKGLYISGHIFAICMFIFHKTGSDSHFEVLDNSKS